MASKKNKKVFKTPSVLAPKLALNQRWVRWRQDEMKTRQAAAASSIKKLAILSLFKDLQGSALIKFDNDSKMRLSHQIWHLNKRVGSSRSRNYCHYIGRSRSINRKLYMARHTFRKFARFGMLPGFVKERD